MFVPWRTYWYDMDNWTIWNQAILTYSLVDTCPCLFVKFRGPKMRCIIAVFFGNDKANLKCGDLGEVILISNAVRLERYSHISEAV